MRKLLSASKTKLTYFRSTYRIIPQQLLLCAIHCFVLFFSANVAAAFSGIAYYGLFFPYTLIKFEKLGLREKLFMSLMFNIAMSFGAKTIGLYEATGKE